MPFDGRPIGPVWVTLFPALGIATAIWEVGGVAHA